jgi:hypothetical protein
MPTDSNGAAAAPAAGESPAASGAQHGTAGRGGRGRGQHDRRNNCPNNRPSSGNTGRSQTKFEGREPSLKGFIYDSTGERSPNQYIKTTKEVINYIRRAYTKYTAEFTQAVRDLELMVPTPPADPDPTNMIAFEMWKLETRNSG